MMRLLQTRWLSAVAVLAAMASLLGPLGSPAGRVAGVVPALALVICAPDGAAIGDPSAGGNAAHHACGLCCLPAAVAAVAPARLAERMAMPIPAAWRLLEPTRDLALFRARPPPSRGPPSLPAA